MLDFTADNLTEAVVEAYLRNTSDPRLKQVLESLIRHLHAFVKDVKLTEAEWFAGIQFLTATGQKSDDKRQEFILLSDVLGVSMLVDAVNHARAGLGTENTVLGPFYVPNSPDKPMGASIIGRDIGGEPVLVKGKVTDEKGRPISGAVLDVWQAADNGFYHMQDQEAPDYNLCGQFRTGADGLFAFVTEKPAPYPIPTDGPVGRLLQVSKRSAMRPAHIHFIVRAAGYDQLTTHLFIRGDKYLETDPVFATKSSLIADPTPSSDAAVAKQYRLKIPFSVIEWNFGLMPVPGRAAA